MRDVAKMLATMVALIAFAVVVAPWLFRLFFALCDWLYRRGVEGHWL